MQKKGSKAIKPELSKKVTSTPVKKPSTSSKKPISTPLKTTKTPVKQTILPDETTKITQAPVTTMTTPVKKTKISAKGKKSPVTGKAVTQIPVQNIIKEIPMPLSEFNYKDDEQIQEQISKTEQETSLLKGEIEDSIKLSLRLKKKIVQASSFNAQTFPMLVSLQIEKLKSSSKAPLDLVCVIDKSGSMRGSKIMLVKKAFNYLLNYLGENDRLSVVTFDHTASRILPLMRTTEENKAQILQKIKEVKDDDGFTDINLGIQHACKVLYDRRYKNPVTSIFLLSDGLDNGAQHKIKTSLSSMRLAQDVTISTFGFGNDHDPQLMNDIADMRDGNFYFIKELDTIDEAFVDCLGGLLSAIAQNVAIQIRTENPSKLPGVQIVKAYGDATMWSKEGNTYITKLSTLISGTQKDFVLELSIPANKMNLNDNEKNVVIASAGADLMTLDGQHITKKAELAITLLNEGEEFKEDEEDDREVMKNFFRLKGALVINEARKLADERKYDEAKQKLFSLKEELENSFLKDEEFIKNLVKDIEQTITNVEPAVYEQSGRHEMLENARAQMHQKSNLKSANCYSNDIQQEMRTHVKVMKSKK